MSENAVYETGQNSKGIYKIEIKILFRTRKVGLLHTHKKSVNLSEHSLQQQTVETCILLQTRGQ